ncbi:hypothetical protein U0070_014278 [Myodes glareolus]|uniref:Uncharacterized protein n=1 Tax=Myodes glareolus TaxID=447135 RepID=A0AAW0I1T6_MYOGA
MSHIQVSIPVLANSTPSSLKNSKPIQAEIPGSVLTFCVRGTASFQFSQCHVFERYGVEPPGLIKLEKEIEQEETLSAPSPSPSPSSKSSGKKSTGNLLDDAGEKSVLLQLIVKLTAKTVI